MEYIPSSSNIEGVGDGEPSETIVEEVKQADNNGVQDLNKENSMFGVITKYVMLLGFA
ncbi:hypothetical protein HK098_005208 [Nowakowskiella sp. JEL0407]|nr:hypothetical protein HK098_005208 [Nowakowskiella sp. JEL0407]